MTLDDITYIFRYRRDKLPYLEEQARSHNSAASDAIVDGFMEYGWSLLELLDSDSKVMEILKPYLQYKRPHADGSLGDSEPRSKRQRVNQSEAYASLPDHEFLATLDRSSLGYNEFDQVTSSRIDDNIGSTPNSTAAAVQKATCRIHKCLSSRAASGSPRHDLASQGQNAQGIPRDKSIQRRISISSAGGVSPKTFIPPLFYAMGNCIPKLILDRAVSPQARWSKHGEFEKVTPRDASLHWDMVDLLSDETKFKQDVEELVSRSVIHKEGSGADPQTYTCQSEPARTMYHQNKAYWIYQAFELCCYVFPRDQILESS